MSKNPLQRSGEAMVALNREALQVPIEGGQTELPRAHSATQRGPEMTTYYVVWDIEVDADSPEEAARIAREIQLDPDSTATVFYASEVQGAITRAAPNVATMVDLLAS